MAVDDRSGAGGPTFGGARLRELADESAVRDIALNGIARDGGALQAGDLRTQAARAADLQAADFQAAMQQQRDQAWSQHRSVTSPDHRVAPVVAPGYETAYGALDLGTNNCRLLIAKPASQGFRVIDAFSRIVRLGEGLAGSGSLSREAMDRAIDALRVCAQKLELRKTGKMRLVATEACRAAANGTEFIDRVSDETGLDLEIINQETEAALAVTGCAALADVEADSVIVFDIGGGSTEIIWLGGRLDGRDPGSQIKNWASLPIGVVTMAERHGGVIVTPKLFETMVDVAAKSLQPFAETAAAASGTKGFHLLGTSGTVTTVAGIHLGLERYDRRQVDGLWMTDGDVGDVMQRLIGMDYAARAANACIGADRADLVLAGCAIFEAIRRAFPSPRIRVADRGLREGILLKLMHEDDVWRRVRR